MDLNSIIRGEGAANIQLVINAKDLRDFADSLMKYATQTIQERDEPKYYTREELRDEVLHVSDPTLRKYREEGLIPKPVTIGGRVLYDKAEVRKALEEGKMRINILLISKLLTLTLLRSGAFTFGAVFLNLLSLHRRVGKQAHKIGHYFYKPLGNGDLLPFTVS